jgi:hypothetical protein
MTNRVHTILSLLAEDHAPAALRPSILLAVDWPTVAEEAPATGDDASAAAIAHLRIQGIVADNHRATAPLAARLATVAASLTASGDKAMTTHAAALWGAAAALVGLPTTAPPAEWGEFIQGIASLTGARAIPSHAGVMLDAVKRWHAVSQAPTNVDPSTAEIYLRSLAGKVSDIFPNPGDISGPAKQATIVGTAIDTLRRRATNRGIALESLGWDRNDDALPEWAKRRAQNMERPIAKPLREVLGLRPDGVDDVVNAVRDLKASESKALADIHALRDILGVPDGGNLVDHASAFAKRHMRRCYEADIEAGRINEENTKLKSENSRLRAQVDRMIAAALASSGDKAMATHATALWGAAAALAGMPTAAAQTSEFATPECLAARYIHALRDILGVPDGGNLHGKASQMAAPDMTIKDEAVLVARDLGTDPEAWRKAMREWTANGNKPCAAK